MRIAIDGPAAAGKTSTAKMVAKNLGITYVNTGAMYRATAIMLMETDIDYKDENAVEEALKTKELTIQFKENELGQMTILNGKDVTSLLNNKNVAEAASIISVFPAVREELSAMQKEMAAKGGVIMEGRDIGTVIMPDADIKIYLTADVRRRAERRHKDLRGGEVGPFSNELKQEQLKILGDLNRRDYRDMHREISPLTKADDAIEIDNSNIDLICTADIITALAWNKIRKEWSK